MSSISAYCPRRVALLSLALILGLGHLACNQQAAAPPATELSEAHFDVEGMTCASCTVTVRVAAKKVDGVVDAGADVKKKTAWARYDPHKTDPQAIAAAISAAGYKATPIEGAHEKR